jgi:hypothetical protein
MYTLEQLQQKTFKELKQIGWNLNVLPAGDRRCRQSWIDALVGVNPPLLQLLEVSPGVEVEQVQEAIEVQAQEPIESKFGRIVYPKPAAELIAINEETRPDIDRTESADLHNQRPHTSELQGSNSGAKTQALGNQKGDRVLAVEGNHQADKRRFVPRQPNELTATGFNDEQPPNRGDGRGRLETELKVSQSAIGFSSRFLALYPPYFGEVNYKADATGQLNLLEPATDDEPPDPDDFESLDAFGKAMAVWDAENLEPLAVSMDSMCEWAPCPADWYEPEAEKLPLKASSMRELTEVSELSPTGESSDTSEFSIPTFDVWCDRAKRQDGDNEPPDPHDFDSMFAFWAAYDAWLGEDDDSNEPPDTGIFARLPKPKPPSFPPMVVAGGDRSNIKKFARSTALLSGRSPPGGDAI